MSRHLRASLLLGAWILGSSASAQRARLPTVDGLPIWMTPLADAPNEVREAIEIHARARRARLSPPSAGAEMAWGQRTLGPWVTQSRDAMREIEQRLGRRDGPISWALVGRVLHADLLTHLGTSVLDLPVPSNLGRDPEIREVFTRTLEETMLPVLEQARQSLAGCAHIAHRVEAPLDAWGARCRERGEALDERLALLRASTGAPTPEARALRGPAAAPACASSGGVRRNVETTGLDEREPLRVAVLYEGHVLSRAADERRLEAAVARALAEREHQIVPARDVATARRLVQTRRWQPRGPTCAAPPPLPALLAEQHPNLLLAEVREKTCPATPPPSPGVSTLTMGCAPTLEVRYRRPSGMHATTPAPSSLEGRLDGTSPSHLLAATRRLEEAQPFGMVGVLGALGTGGGLSSFRDPPTRDAGSLASLRSGLGVTGFESPDPFVSPVAAIHAKRRELRACFAGEGIGAFPASFTIDATGAPAEVVVEHGLGLEGSDQAREAARACVARVLSTLRFTCPRAGTTRVTGHVCLGAR